MEGWFVGWLAGARTLKYCDQSWRRVFHAEHLSIPKIINANGLDKFRAANQWWRWGGRYIHSHWMRDGSYLHAHTTPGPDSNMKFPSCRPNFWFAPFGSLVRDQQSPRLPGLPAIFLLLLPCCAQPPTHMPCTDYWRWVHIDYGRMFAHCTNSNSTRREPEPEKDENHDSGFYKRGIIGFRITTDRQDRGRAGDNIPAEEGAYAGSSSALKFNPRSVSIRSLPGFVARKWIPDSWLVGIWFSSVAGISAGGGGLSGKESPAEHLPLIYGFPARGKLSAGE